MADLDIQKYHSYYDLKYKLTLKRFYVGDDPDIVGSIDFWLGKIEANQKTLCDPKIVEGLNLEIWDMRSPDLLNTSKSTLLDYDLHKDGNQIAGGLYFSPKRIALGVWVDRYYPNMESYEWSSLNLPHELGHLYDDLAGYGLSKTPIQVALTEYFNLNRPLQTDKVPLDKDQKTYLAMEDWAESYRAVNGESSVLGTFSDQTKFSPTPDFRTFMRTAFRLNDHIGSSAIQKLTFKSTYCQWEQKVILWGFYPTWIWFALTDQLDLFEWERVYVNEELKYKWVFKKDLVSG